MLFLFLWALTGLIVLVISRPFCTEPEETSISDLAWFIGFGPVCLVFFLWWLQAGSNSKVKGFLTKKRWRI